VIDETAGAAKRGAIARTISGTQRSSLDPRPTAPPTGPNHNACGEHSAAYDQNVHFIASVWSLDINEASHSW